MTGKADFTPEEWKTLLESTVMAGIAVTAADPSGFVGIIQESLASTSAVREAGQSETSGELAKAISAELEASDRLQAVRDAVAETLWGSAPPQIIEKALDVLRRAAAIVEAKAASEAPEFKTWLLCISRTVAEAGTEGGFLGFGGVRVSEAEKATLAQISDSLGLPA